MMIEPDDQSPADVPALMQRPAEIVVAALLLLFGAVVAWDSYKLGASWGDEGPQSGYFPFYIGLFICVSSLVTLVQALTGSAALRGKVFVERRALRRVLAVLLPAGLYVLGIHLIGIYVASAVYIAVFMVWLGGYSRIRSATLGIMISVVVFVMFEVWFKVPLHKGTLYNPLNLIGY